MSGDGDTPAARLKARRLACENTRFNVYFDHVIDANGTEVPNYLVVAPHSRRDDLLTGIAVVAVWDGNVVLLRSYRHAVEEMVLEAARGFIDAGETPAQAALRELKEETGLVCPPEALVPLGTCLPEAGLIRARVALFVATACQPSGEERDTEEFGLGDRVVLPQAEVRALLARMALEDVTTTLALHRYFILCDSAGLPA